MAVQLIQARRLSKSYRTGGDAEVHALRNVDVDIAAGELTVLMGSSGSGKSTLLYLLSGLEAATAGEITFDGRRVDRLDETALSLLRRTDLGFVFQAINLIPHLSLLENVAVPGLLVERNRQAVRERALALLDRFGIAELADRLPAQVSGGEQQRTAIARALVNRPRAVLADEPTGALDSAAGRTVLDALRQIRDGGDGRERSDGAQSVIMATHEVRAACYGDRILYLRDGEVQSEFRPASASGIEEREGPVLDWLKAQGW